VNLLYHFELHKYVQKELPSGSLCSDSCSFDVHLFLRHTVLAAAVWAIDNYHVYLYSRRFTLLTDHRPVEKMLCLHQKTFNRLQQQMLKYNFIVLYQKGEANGGSRNPVDSMATEPTYLIKLQAQDKFMKQIIDYLADKWLPPQASKAKHIIQYDTKVLSP
jgi:hypothetical protein